MIVIILDLRFGQFLDVSSVCRASNQFPSMLLDEIDTNLATISLALAVKVILESIFILLFSPLHDGDGLEPIG